MQLFAMGCTVKFGPGDPICGNGTAEGDEACDGEDLKGETCEGLGLGGGTLACRADCTGFDASGCGSPPECGNNIKEEGEVCDGTDLGGKTCESLGLGGGTLTCRTDCTGFDASGCGNPPECGNNIKEFGEVCDGTDLDGQTCETQGFYSGTLGCLTDCTGFDTSGCNASICGNNIAEYGEVCDGVDLNGETCETQGFYGGELSCFADCTGFDTSGCDPCPDGWVYIPAGEFEMGCNQGDPCWAGYSRESPRHTVTLSAYCIPRTEVSVAQYRECKIAGGCPIGTPTLGSSGSWENWTASPGDREDHPMNGINWAEAREYCRWTGGDLPTEAQWEKAARGTDQRTYPWGDEPGPNCDRCNWNYTGEGFPYGCHNATEGPGTWPAGYLTTTAGDSPHGLKDMLGNVREWTLDCYDPDFYATCGDNCVDPASNVVGCPGNRVVRGGCFYTDDVTRLRVVYRGSSDPTHRRSYRGFRCVKPPAE